ncbi:MAG: hypothetical protein R3F59_06555 [Myxococcota bacterium]
MSAVEVEIAEDVPHGDDAPEPERGERSDRSERRREQRRPDSDGIEREREITKRQIIQSVSTIVVVILYMVFTLLRDRETGVVVVDPDESDDWDDDA